jgi:hypothetical protein
VFHIRGGQNRREFLRIGGLGLGGITLAGLLRSESEAAAAAKTTKAEPHTRPKSVIYIVLGGGPSHIDMWDLKPDAPAEVRGPFKPAPTAVPGVQICEHMPLQASIMDRLALLRGVRSVENDHFLSEVYSGLPRGSGRRPAFGSVVSKLAGGEATIPPYVSLNRASTDQFEFEKPYYAGAQHAPFRPFGEALEDLNPAKSLDQLVDRKALLARFDNLRRDLERNGAFEGQDAFKARALEIITSPKVRDAFDLSKESDKTIARYGKGRYPHQTFKTIMYDWDSRPFLLARRLVEAGVRVVTLRPAEWDHHSSDNGDIFFALKCLMPALDRSLHALVTDLEARGLSEDVLVVVLGEFGRTPKIAQPGPGREHWADAGCAVLAGGGLKMGQVVGQTDSRAERAKVGNMSFQNVIATLYHVLGIDMKTTLPDFNGRPQTLLDDTKPIEELVG